MIALVIGDTHGNAEFVSAVLNAPQFEDVELFIQLGDFGCWPQSQFPSFVNTLAFDMNKPFWFVEGNHDYGGPIDTWADAMYLDPPEIPPHYDHYFAYLYNCVNPMEPGLHWMPRGTTFEVNDITLGFLGGAVSIDRDSRVYDKSWWPYEVISDRDVELVKKCDVWFTHDAPDIPFPLRDFATDDRFPLYLREEMWRQRKKMRAAFDQAQPRLHIHGHWHYRYEAPTTYGKVIGLGFEAADALFLMEI